MYPLLCTQNTQSHVDYGIPITTTKSTDYRTSTGTYHRFIPNVPQHYNCGVKATIKPELKATDVTIRDDRKSVYKNTYIPLPIKTDPVERDNERAQSLTKGDYIRNVQEKMFDNPPPPIASKISEMKDSYRLNSYISRFREVTAPSLEAKCEIEGLLRPLQAGIPPGEHGHWKYLDIYMTENRLRYPPYSKEQMDKAEEDIPTYYSASGKYKNLKVPLPGPLTGNTSVYDKAFFKHQVPIRCLSRAPKNVPNMKFKTEYRGSYVSQTYSDMYPYIQTSGVHFADSLADAGPWQNLSPAGMYCTEYCHTGTGWPVRAVVNTGLEDPKPPHNTSTSSKSQS
ncbi:hypothetical protein NQ315_012529 [Exocentrus adspersus]|uniref:Uncharacterized protein n=1 Tax=Exocentrus adspersus TaxID=1586481 RepID=A0AAV8VCP7_9CUCU|nr:hypothetical protein NQ315_012529 [Exocentrus adspersus]